MRGVRRQISMASRSLWSAAVYRLPNGVFVHSQSRTHEGVWVASLPAMLLPLDVDAGALGVAAAEALAASASIEDVNYRVATAPVLEAAGARSWSRIHRNAKLCTVSRSLAGSAIQPTRNGGTAGDDRGFHELPGERIQIKAGCSDADLGRAILSGLSRCE